MKTNLLPFLFLSLIIFSCDPDDEMPICETLIEHGRITAGFALDMAPIGYFDRIDPLILVNDNQDSLVFTAQNKTEFANDQIIKTLCENGDSTTHIYDFVYTNKSFTADDGSSLNIQTNPAFANGLLINDDGSIDLITQNCLVQFLTVFFRPNNDSFTNISQRFNPEACTAELTPIGPQTSEPVVELNGTIYENVFVNSSTPTDGSHPYTLYYSNDIGIIGFEDSDEVLWIVAN